MIEVTIMKNQVLGRRIILITFFLLILYLSYLLYGKLNQNEFNVYMKKSDIYLDLKINDVYIFNIEVRSLVDKEKDGLEYRRVYKQNIDGNIPVIVIKNYKNYGMGKNRPYYFSVASSGEVNEPGVVKRFYNFCIRDENTIYTEKDDKKFIKNCLN